MKFKIAYIITLAILPNIIFAVSANIEIPGIGGVGANIGSEGIGASASALGIGAGGQVDNQGIQSAITTPIGNNSSYQPSIFARYPTADIALTVKSYPTGESSVSIIKSEHFAQLGQLHQNELLRGLALKQQENITYFYKLSSDEESLIFVGT